MRQRSIALGLAVSWLLLADPRHGLGNDPAGKADAGERPGRFAEAAKAYADALRADENDAASLNALAWLQATCPDASCRDGKAAVGHATKAAELTGWKNPDELDTLAAAYAERGDFGNAALWQGLAAELAPAASKPAFAARLDLYRRRQPFREGEESSAAPATPYRTIADCDAALAARPDDVRAYARRGQLRFDRKEYDLALADFTRLIALEPTRVAHLRGRAIIHREKGDLDKALADYAAALKLAPTNPLFFSERAAVYRSRGDAAKALADEANAHVARALRCVTSERYSEAVQEYQSAIKLAPSSPRAYNQLAWLRATCPAADQRDGKAAVADAAPACELTDYKNYAYLDTLAAAHAEQGDFDQAVTWEYLAIELAPAAKKPALGRRLKLFLAKQPYLDATDKP